jgi:hypothetical protein
MGNVNVTLPSLNPQPVRRTQKRRTTLTYSSSSSTASELNEKIQIIKQLHEVSQNGKVHTGEYSNEFHNKRTGESYQYHWQTRDSSVDGPVKYTDFAENNRGGQPSEDKAKTCPSSECAQDSDHSPKAICFDPKQCGIPSEPKQETATPETDQKNKEDARHVADCDGVTPASESSNSDTDSGDKGQISFEQEETSAKPETPKI